MKKLLSLALCAAAATTFAADEITLADEIGVTMVSIPAGQANTIIAASFKELSTGNNISAANLVRTTGLKKGSKLYLYGGTKDTYSVWTLDADGGKWVAAAKTYTIAKDGTLTVGEGPLPTTTLPRGTGLWLVRSDATDAVQVALYGAFVSDDASVDLKGDRWQLVGNPNHKSDLVISTGSDGDRLVAVNEKGVLRTYQYRTTIGWSYVTYDASGKPTRNSANPTIAAGKGFWYLSKTDKSLTFK